MSVVSCYSQEHSSFLDEELYSTHARKHLTHHQEEQDTQPKNNTESI